MLVAHNLDHAIRAQAGDRAAHIKMRLIDGIAERLARIAQHRQGARLRHEGGHVADRAFDDDIDALHRNAAPCAGVAIDHKRSAMGGGAGGLAGVSFHMHEAGHHVLGDADASVAVDNDMRLLVHAGAVIADMPIDIDLNRRGQANRDGVATAGIEDAPIALISLPADAMQDRVQPTNGFRFKVDGMRGGDIGIVDRGAQEFRPQK